MPRGHSPISPHALHAHELRLVLCSTFPAGSPERDAIRGLIPELRRHCDERGVDLAEIDPGWGSAGHPHGHDEMVRRSLAESSRHRAVFIGIAGPVRAAPDPTIADHRPVSSWTSSADPHAITAMDVMRRVASDPRMAGRAFFYLLGWKPESEAGGELESHLDDLTRSLVKSRLCVRSGITLPRRLVERMRHDLLGVIEKLFPPAAAISQIARERRSHQAFAERRRDGYVEMAGYLDRLDDHAEHGGDPLVVSGAAGAGKSSLLAYWTDRFRREHPGSFIIEHYAGAGSSDGSPSGLLRRIMAEICERYDLADDLPAGDALDAPALSLWLAKVQRERLVLVIDALDQLDGDDAGTLGWLPEHLPPNVRLVISMVDGEGTRVLKDRGWPTLVVRPLSVAQRRDVIAGVLGDSRRRLTSEQLGHVCGDLPTGNMLFLRTRLEELRGSVTDEKLSRRIDHYRDVRDLDDLFERVLRRFEMEYDAALVRDLLSLVCASRRGLSHAELRDLTGADDDDLSILLAALDFHLMRRDGLYTFFHEHLRRAVETRYLSGDATLRQRLHLRLATYFSTLPVSSRRVDEEPWQWQRASRWDRLKNCVADIPIFMGLSDDDRKYELLEYWRAIGKSSRVVEAYDESLGRYIRVEPDPRRIADVRMALGRFFFELGHYGDAERLCRRALTMRKDILGTGHIDTVESMEELGAICLYASKHHEALHHFRCALGIKELLLGKDHELTARGLAKWGAILHLTGKLDEALPVLETAVEQCARVLGPEHPETISALNNLAATFSALGDHRKAAGILEDTRAINERIRGEQQIETAKNILNLGVQYKFLGDIHLAEPLYARALRIFTDVLGPDHPEVARCLTNLGTLFKDMRSLEKAEECYRDALAIRRTVLGDDHLDTHNSWLNIAVVYTEQERFPEARTIYCHALPGKLKILGEEHPAMVHSIRQYRIFLGRMRTWRGVHGRRG